MNEASQPATTAALPAASPLCADPIAAWLIDHGGSALESRDLLDQFHEIHPLVGDVLGRFAQPQESLDIVFDQPQLPHGHFETLAVGAQWTFLGVNP